MASLSKLKNHSGAGGHTRRVLLCLLGFSGTSRAQPVILAPPTYSSTPPAVMAAQDERTGSLQSPSLSSFLPQFSDFFHIGPVNSDPHFVYQAIYGNGIQVSPGQSSSTFIQEFSPGVTLTMGTHWSLDYTPTFTFYTSKQFTNTVDQNVTFQWGTTYEDWVLAVGQTYSAADDTLAQTGGQTSTESYGTSLSASYRINSKLSVDMSLGQSFSYADQFSNARSWSTMEYLNYQFFPRLTAGLGAGLGYSQVTESPDILDESFQARVNVVVQNKLSLSVHGGLEIDQFLGGLGTQVNPVFGVAAQYAPFTYTGISLSADRSISPSLFQNQASVNTTIGLTLSQRFFKHFSFSAGLQYNITEFEASAAVSAPARTDDYYSLNASLSWQFLKRANASITYQYSNNGSTTNAYSFNSSQLALQVGYRF